MILRNDIKYRVMKTINTLSILFFLLIAVACSSESDSIMNDIDKEVVGSTERIAMFDFTFSGKDIQTRGFDVSEGGSQPANITTSTEATISNCFIAALNENEEVLASFFYNNSSLSQKEYVATINEHMIIKVPADKLPALRFYAVTNLYDESKNKLLACTSLDAIKQVTLNDETPNQLVKVGISDELNNYKTSPSIDAHDGNDGCTSVTINVFQRSAAIELAEFKVIGADNEEIEAVVESLQLLNRKEKAGVVGEADGKTYSSAVFRPGERNEMDPNGGIYETYKDIRFYAYDNSSQDNKTSLKITYKVNGVSYDRTYTIKTPGKGEVVVGGNLYQLHVTIKNVLEDIYFDVKDWVPYTINLGDIEGTFK